MNNIIIAGCTSHRGIKLTRFLSNKGLIVFGVDRFEHAPILGCHKYFRIDLRHKDSMRLVMLMVKPEALVYVTENLGDRSFEIADTHYAAYSNFLITGLEYSPKIILCLDDNPSVFSSPYDVLQNALINLTSVFAKKYNLENIIITNKQNLLKEVKQFLIQSNKRREVDEHGV